MKRPALLLLVLVSVIFVNCSENDPELFEVFECRVLDTSNQIYSPLLVESVPTFEDGTNYKADGAAYAEMARRAGIEGSNYVAFNITTEGEVEFARVIRGIGGGLDESSLNAVKSFSYSPAKLKGKTVCSQIIARFDFEVDSYEQNPITLISPDEAEEYLNK